MKKIIATLLFAAAATLAANVQVLAPTGAEFSTDAPQMVQSIVRAAVSATGNTPVEGAGDVQLRTNVMTMGSSFVVVCEQIKYGAVVGSGKQKSESIDNLDVAIEGAVAVALANLAASDVPQGSAAYAPAYEASNPEVVYVVSAQSSEDPNDNFAHKRPTRNYVSYGLGMAVWHNWEDKVGNPKLDWDKGFVFHYGRIFEVIPQAAITIINNMDISFGDEFQWHETFLIGGRFFFSTGAITPFVGAGFGLGLQWDDHFTNDNYVCYGLAGGAELGVIFFRNSAVQLELGGAWDALWNRFRGFDQRFGAGSFYIAINY